MTKSRGINRPRYRWSPAEKRYLRENYADELTSVLARELDIPKHLVHAAAHNMGLKKSAAFNASDKSGRLMRGGRLFKETQFKPGQVPANKGLRRPGYAPGRMAETQFKKGQRGNKWKPIGTELVNSDGYLVRKVAESKRYDKSWKSVHRLVWIAANGPIPKNHMVVFKDKNRLNVKLENLELITRTENACRNRMWTKYPKELARVIALRGAINRQINKRLGRKETYRDRAKAARRVVRHARRLARQGQADGPRSREGDRPGC